LGGNQNDNNIVDNGEVKFENVAENQFKNDISDCSANYNDKVDDKNNFSEIQFLDMEQHLYRNILFSFDKEQDLNNCEISSTKNTNFNLSNDNLCLKNEFLHNN